MHQYNRVAFKCFWCSFWYYSLAFTGHWQLLMRPMWVMILIWTIMRKWSMGSFPVPRISTKRRFQYLVYSPRGRIICRREIIWRRDLKYLNDFPGRRIWRKSESLISSWRDCRKCLMSNKWKKIANPKCNTLFDNV